MKTHPYQAAFLVACALMGPTAFSEPAPVDDTASLHAKQIRLDLDAKRKELSEQTAPAQQDIVAAPSQTLNLPIDQTDSPGATK
jgi:hypothetical protein